MGCRMRVLVAYASALGSTRRIAERMAGQLGQDGIEATARSVEDAGNPAAFDAVVIGSAVHGSHWLPEAVDYVRRHRAELSERPVWLFSSGPVGDLGTRRMPPDPREIAGFARAIRPRDHRTFNGALDRSTVDGSRLGFAARVVAKTLIPEGDYRDWAAIEAWADGIAHDLSRVPPGHRAGMHGCPAPCHDPEGRS